MRIRTFFEPMPEHYSPAHHADVVTLWVATWTALGHDVKVLGRADAEKHPRYQELLAKVRTWPCINPRPYEEACFVRWCAAAVEAESGPITFMDYDVFPTIHHDDGTLVPDAVNYGEMPTCVSGQWNSFRKIIEAFLDFTPCKLCGHVSDQSILRERSGFLLKTNKLSCYGVPNWGIRDMVHFANWTLSRDIPSRAEAIRSFMRNGLVDPALCQ